MTLQSDVNCVHKVLMHEVHEVLSHVIMINEHILLPGKFSQFRGRNYNNSTSIKMNRGISCWPNDELWYDLYKLHDGSKYVRS